jgi:hypothetical protein
MLVAPINLLRVQTYFRAVLKQENVRTSTVTNRSILFYLFRGGNHPVAANRTSGCNSPNRHRDHALYPICRINGGVSEDQSSYREQ